MNFNSMLDPHMILQKLNAKTQEEAFNELTNLFLKQGIVTDSSLFIDALKERENQSSTGIGNFIAIPHGKSHVVQQPGVAIGISNSGIKWDSFDDKKAKVIVMFAIGEDVEAGKDHLKILSMFARKLANKEVVEKLLNATNTQEIIEAFN